LLPLRDVDTSALRQELCDQRAALQQLFSSLANVHFARLAIVPASALEPRPQLLLETSFDGELAPHLDGLWSGADAPLPHILRYCAGSQSVGARAGFHALLQQHLRRAAALYRSSELGVAAIQNDARLATLVRRYSEAAPPPTHPAAGLPWAVGLQRQMSSERDVRLAALTPPSRAPELSLRAFLALGFGRFAAAALTLPWLELRDRFRERDLAPSDAGSSDELGSPPAGTLTHLVALRPGRLRTSWLRLFLQLSDHLFAGRPRGARALPMLRNARWLLLPDGRLLFLGSYDGGLPALLAAVAERAATLSNLVWAHTQGFPAAGLTRPGGVRKRADFQRWLWSHQLPVHFWYSAYPTLSATAVRRNQRLRELLAAPLDAGGTSELCGLV
jgi:hypothetical protein